MPIGKICAMSGHAFKISTKNLILNHSDLAENYFSDGLGTNVCLVASTTEKLLRAYDQAKSLDIPCCLIVDSGHILLPHFTGDPIITAIGIGPATKAQVYDITRRFKLL